ncbi:hypothetical protein Dimus_026498 [Dionaea muscipula]
MAISKAVIVSLLVSLLLLQLVESEETVNGYKPLNSTPTLVKIDCKSACTVRCSKASRTKICLRACGTCCARCNCVPPGTSGNQKDCACYYYMTTHGGRRKCP